MKVNAVFSGGGVKAYAFIGALDVFAQNKIEIVKVGGTSAGAMIASLIYAQYSYREMKQFVFAIDWKEFFDPPFLAGRYSPAKLLSLYFRKGLYKGDRFEAWIEGLLKAKGIVTFQDIRKDHLKVVVSDISKGRLVVIPDDLESVYGMDPNFFKVATAVRMSAGFPYFFMPKQLRDQQGQTSDILDGGLLSNFPLWLFDERDKPIRPTIGVSLSEGVASQAPQKIRNGLDLVQAMVKTMLKAHDSRYIASSDAKDILFIPVKEINPVDFNLSEGEKRQLLELGRQRAESFFRSWNF